MAAGICETWMRECDGPADTSGGGGSDIPKSLAENKSDSDEEL